MTKILLVDDDYVVRLLYEEELSEEGYDVVTCGDCSGLMDAIDEQRPDLIILAVKTSGYDGLDILQEIRNTFYDLPVIVCAETPEFRYDSRSIAADYCVIMGRDFRALCSKIQLALEGSSGFPIYERGITAIASPVVIDTTGLSNRLADRSPCTSLAPIFAL